MARARTIDRRTFMQGVLFSLGAGGLLPFAGCGPGRRSPGMSHGRRPNIVFIIADDLGWADLGYGGSAIRTPNIDRLAAGGVRLKQHYVMPTCTPTRVGLMTGRYPSRYGVLSPAYGQIFDEETVTVAEALKRSGYQTVISGKWHMGSPPDCVPTKFGFTESYGYFDGQIDPYTHLYKTGRQCWHRNDELITEEGHATDLITDEAVRVIRASGKQPLFLYVAYSVPHYPIDEPPEWLDMYADIEQESRRWYAASVTHMDAGIGRIVEAIDKAGMRENTLIVFVSDNGAQKRWQSATEYGGHYADRPHTVLGDNRPLRGWKGDVFEGGIRVPGLANWHGVLRPRQMDAPMHIVDWMPTLCRVAQADAPENLSWDGQDVWDVLSGAGELADQRRLYWKTPAAYALRVGDYKLITNKEMARPMLFDLAADPLEENNLASEQPDRVEQMIDILMETAAADTQRVQ